MFTGSLFPSDVSLVVHCISGGSEFEPAEEACSEKVTHVAAGHVTTEEVSFTRHHHQTYCCFNYTGCGQKSGPLKFFAVFSATVWNFNLKFYRCIYKNLLHLTAKYNVILLKNDEVTDFLT